MSDFFLKISLLNNFNNGSVLEYTAIKYVISLQDLNLLNGLKYF